MQTKKQLLRDRIMREIKTQTTVSTWHLGDLIYDAGKIMGWNVRDIETLQRNLRYHLIKVVKEGVLKKKRTGTGFLGKTDFGVTSSNTYYKTGTMWDKV